MPSLAAAIQSAPEAPAPAPLGTRENLREAIAEAASMAALTANMICAHCEVADDVGMSYTTRRLIAYVRFLAGAVRDLKSDEMEGGDA
jgi:hypothetical protein